MVECFRQGHNVGDLSVQLRFADIRVKLMYLPFYNTSYKHENQNFKLIVDGQKVIFAISLPRFL